MSDSREDREYDVDVRDICVVSLLSYGIGVAHGIELGVWGPEEARVKEQIAIECVKAGNILAREIQNAVELRSALGFTSVIRGRTIQDTVIRVTPRHIVGYYAMHVFQSRPKTRNFNVRYSEFLG